MPKKQATFAAKCVFGFALLVLFFAHLDPIGGPNPADRATRTIPQPTAVQPEFEVDAVPFGEAAGSGPIVLLVSDASIDLADLIDATGAESKSKEPKLIVTIAMKNVGDGRAIQYQGDGRGFWGTFRLVDDADKAVQLAYFGQDLKVVGELKHGEELAPGAAKEHVQAFEVPPRNAKYVILKVHLLAFGQPKNVRFRIPAEKIKNFPPTNDAPNQ